MPARQSTISQSSIRGGNKTAPQSATTRQKKSVFPERTGGRSWDDYRIMMAVAETGSLRAASRSLSMSRNTVKVHLDMMERDLGGALFRADHTGISLTPLGAELSSVARRMHMAEVRLPAYDDSDFAAAADEVRIATTEGLGTFWLMPRIGEFLDSHSDIRASLQCEMRGVDTLFRNVDLAVQLDRPPSPDLMIQRIGSLHLTPFATQAYLDTHGVPALGKLEGHRLIWQEAPQVRDDLLTAFLPDEQARQLVKITTNSSTSHFAAIQGGAGVGFLPSYAALLSDKLVPIPLEIPIRRDIFLVAHAETVPNPRVQAAKAWLKSAFDPQRFPWFGDERYDPALIRERYDSNVVVNMFSSRYQAKEMPD
ncbi:MAG: LysR family transcriptional regulator [Pacificimonas sp.]